MTTPTSPAVCVLLDGPESGGIDERTGDEFPLWTVCAADADGNPIGKVYAPRSYATARRLAADMARARRLELVDDSTPE